MSIRIAEQYESNEQYEQAYEEYKKELQHAPNDLSLLERLGHLAMMLNKKDEAADFYSKILEKDMTNVLCYEQLMDIYSETDRYKYYVYRGNLHSIENKIEQAISDFKKALPHAQNENEIIMIHYTLANLYDQTGNTSRSIDEFIKTLEYEDNRPEIFLKLADVYIKEDILTSAIDVLERARKRFDNTEINEKLAQIYLKNNQPEKAKDLTQDEMLKIRCMLECGEENAAYSRLTELETTHSNNPEYYSLKAQYYYINQKYNEALECVNKYENINKNSPITYQMKALIYESMGDEYNAHLNWGKYNLVRGNKDIATNEFLNAYQLNNDDIKLMHTLAILLEETGDKNHSIEFWEKISKKDPTSKKALEKLADFREDIGDYNTQAEYLEKLHELDIKNATVVKKLAKTYEKIKNKPSAIKYYKKYLEMSVGTDDYNKISERLQKLEQTSFQEDEGLIDKIMRIFKK